MRRDRDAVIREAEKWLAGLPERTAWHNPQLAISYAVFLIRDLIDSCGPGQAKAAPDAASVFGEVSILGPRGQRVGRWSASVKAVTSADAEALESAKDRGTPVRVVIDDVIHRRRVSGRAYVMARLRDGSLYLLSGSGRPSVKAEAPTAPTGGGA